MLALLVTGALNTRPTVVLRLLTWQSPSLPLGAWIAAAAAGGGALSAASAALALRDPGPGLRRRVRREPEREAPWDGADGKAWGQSWSAERSRAARSESGNAERSQNWRAGDNRHAREFEQPLAWRQAASAGPDRAPGEPPPTLSVPYRVIRRGMPESPLEPMDSAAPMPQEQRPVRGGWSDQGNQRPSAEAVPVADDWGSDSLEDW